MTATTVWARLLPPPTHIDGRGARLAGVVLAGLGVLDLVRGSIHLFAPDGGAGRIAGIDLTRGGEVIVMLFAVMGANQILWGLLNLLVALRYRTFVALLLLLQIAQHVLAAWILWIYKPLMVPAPGKYGVLATLPLLALALWLSMRGTAAQAAHRDTREILAE
ncbi:MAG TPA: hypothetical protein VKM54_17975 [Myxococcota bacterium]|nr:hypothetical protein [Myxococcota bacterium]